MGIDEKATTRRDPRSERWKHLLKTSAQPRTVDVGEFVEELNRRLRNDAGWRPDVRFTVAKPSLDGRFGPRPSWIGPDEARPLVHRVLQGVVADYRVDAPFLLDR